MAGGRVVIVGRGKKYDGGITAFMVITCMVAAMGGLIFGYCLGISGGVTSMEDFLEKFFPSVYNKMKHKADNIHEYCAFDSQLLTSFTSSLYVAALAASFCAYGVTRSFGRKTSMLIGGLVFLAGFVLNGAAVNIEMLIMGRFLLGVGVGFGNQSVPLYLSEMAPAKRRGALNMAFQLTITLGIFIANLINYITAKIQSGWGWRLSLALAAVPAVMMAAGSIFLPDTPNSILERGKVEEARKVLQKVRGTENVDDEFHDLIEACVAAKKVEHPWKNIMQPAYRPQLVMCILVPFFQQFTGINVIVFYAPILFRTLDFEENVSLMSTAITGAVNVFSTIVSIVCVDRFGRRALFLEGGLQMFISQIAAAIMICLNFGNSYILLFMICAYVAAFAWSWGPLGWLVPSEICPLEIRSAAQAINVSVNMLFTFVIAQIFLSMLCHMKFGLFFFFAGFVVVMTVFIYLFMPETKNIPIEEMNRVWKAHWFWGKYIPDEVGTKNGAENISRFV